MTGRVAQAGAAVGAPLPYLQAYPVTLQQQVQAMLQRQGTGAWLLQKYPQAHAVRTDKALYQYTAGLRARHLPFTVDEGMRDAWMLCMREALDGLDAPPEVTRRLYDALWDLADFMRNS